MSVEAVSVTPEQRQALRDARVRARTFVGAERVAGFNGWTLGACASASILFGSSHPIALLMGVGLGAIARNEFVGRNLVRKLEISGLELLWRNQIGLMALVIAYCIVSMYNASAHPDPQMAMLTEMLGTGTGELLDSLTRLVYQTMIALTVIFQGLNARYYYVRIERLRDHVRRTPRWVLNL